MGGKPTVDTTTHVRDGITRFRITHPFHPLHGLEFEALDLRQVFKRQVFVFVDPAGRKVQVPLAWTDAAAADPFLVISDGRSHFRVEDLLRLSELIGESQR
jgi:hypothetical protein